MEKTIEKYLKVAEGLSKLLGDHGEIILHNLKTNSVEAIFGSMSNRRSGDPSNLDKFGLTADVDIVGPYDKTNPNGRELKSISIPIKDDNRETVGFFCVNIDKISDRLF